MVTSPIPYDLPFSRNMHDWHAIVRFDPLRSSKVIDFHVIWKPICDFILVINSNLGPIYHRLATIHLWQKDERQTDDKQMDNNRANSWTVT